MNFKPYPFEKLNDLLQNITPNPDFAPAILTIGEPQFETPEFIQKELCNSASLLKKYPKTGGEAILREAMRGFVARRFGVELSDAQIIPTFGTREVLFNFPQFLLLEKENSVMAYTNPHFIRSMRVQPSLQTLKSFTLTSQKRMTSNLKSMKQSSVVLIWSLSTFQVTLQRQH